MEDLKTKAEQLTHHVSELAETYYQLTIVTLTQKTAKAATSVFSLAVLFLFSLSILVLMGIGLAVWLGDMLNNTAAGYFLSGVIYILLLALYYALRKKFIFPYIRDYIVRKLNI